MQDDYVKFIRLAQHAVETTGSGILGLITNHAYLDNATFRGARQSLMSTFCHGWFLDLHGNTKKRERHPDGSIDLNVFEIQQGVAISILMRNEACQLHRIDHSEVFGTREAKYEFLGRSSSSSTEWQAINPISPFYLFIPQNQTLFLEYQCFHKITDIMPVHSNGVVTARDHLSIGWSAEEAWNVVIAFTEMEPEDARAQFDLGDDSRDWKVRLAQADVKKDGPSRRRIIPIYYRPFDTRWTYYTGRSRGYLCMPRSESMSNMLTGTNLALITSRMTKGEVFQHVQATRSVSEAIVMSPKTSNNGFILPLYLQSHNVELEALTCHSQPDVNFAPVFLEWLSGALGLPQTDPYGIPVGMEPEDIFHYIYALFHSPSYRSRYAEFLKVDFPRLPLTGNPDLFHALARLGGELTALHLLESPRLAQPITAFIGVRNPAVEKVSWSGDTVWVDKAQSTGFGGVREDVWNFHIGGYQVCEKWLKDRGPKKGKPGRTLSTDDIAHYQKIVVAISETIRLMKEIDEVIEAHGGWPGAFETSAPAVESSKAVPAAAMQSAASTLLPFRPRTVEPSEPDRYVTCVPIFELAAAAGGFGEAQHVDEDSIEWVALDTRRKLRRGMFVARVVGRSMEPTIPDGSYCLFSSPVEGTREGKTVLVQLRDAKDPDTGQRYTVKRYESVKRVEADLWQHEAITLKPINPDFEPIHLTGETDNEYQVIAEFLEVLREPADEDAAGGHEPTVPVARFESRSGAASVEPVEEIELDDDAADVRRVDVDDLDRDEVICLIRQVLGDGVTRPRDAAIRELARALGYARTGSRVSKVLDNALVTAVRRGVIANIGGDLKLEARRIDEYDRDFLKAQFLASLDGRAWKDRADAIRDFARWMGFRRTGAVIEETARSLIKGLLRAGRLEADGQSIRRSG